MQKVILIGLFCIISICEKTARAQRSNDIRVDANLLADMKAASILLNLDGAVIVGDTIIIEDNLEMNKMSLFLICNYLQSGNKTITILPHHPDSSSFRSDGKGLAGQNITVFSRSAVSGKYILPGGAGKAGANGRDGRNGVRPSRGNCCTAENRGTAGANGADGMPGGNGGIVKIMSLAENNLNHANVRGEGGLGGAGGSGGIGGTSYWETLAPSPGNHERPTNPGNFSSTKEKDGNPGAPGAKGANATSEIQKIVMRIFEEELHKYGVDSLGGSQIAFTTLISLQPRVVSPGNNNSDIDGNEDREIR